MMFQVDFKGEKVIRASKYQTILEASLQAGIPHYHACGGKGECTTCRVLVLEGAEQLSDINTCERTVRVVRNLPENVRLACQTHVQGEGVKLNRLIKDDLDRFIFIHGEAENTTQVMGQRGKMALFFIDIRNFTPFMETNLPFDVIHIMRRVFTLFRNAIEQYEGRIIDTAGDGLYAVFGLNSRIKQATENAVLAGIKIQEDVKVFNNTYMKTYFDHAFEVGIGLHVGQVIYGNVGIGNNDSLSVMGFPVNVAARLQASTKDLNNSFVISETAFSLLRNPPYVAGSANIHLKGVSNTFQVRLIGKPFQYTATAVPPAE
ncbi:adenylate/guanylate cyclase domain-containing protein [Rufibacter latericius]|uniref:Adenylate/guanylate cyclase domain-containing protein n=1 Tax=Rufibacter latericius TaxID=2487040 RepID=A0A3M9MQ97_9BACT|nr:adenylate/guanylate cyclase domain-containing protein [Rufibacter latericius]RNI26868.1 adenylate/guanylate cyclase domain-containing protein [Rufibacter latericius]